MSPAAPLAHLAINANGIPLPPEALGSLEKVFVQARLSLPAQCELTFSDPPGPLEGVALLTPGTRLRLTVAGHGTDLFEGEVTVQEEFYGPAGERALHVRAYDALHRLRKTQPVRSFVQVSLGDLARELTAELGVSLVMSGSGPTWPQVIQHNQSDLDLLAQKAGECGLYLALRQGRLYLQDLAGSGTPVALEWGKSLLEARFTQSGEAVTRQVEVQGWNAQQGEAHTVQSGSPHPGWQGSRGVDPGQVGGGDRRTLAGVVVEDDRHASALAQAELDRRASHAVSVWGVAEGHPALQPGVPVSIQGVDRRWMGQYVLVGVTHTLDARRGFLTEFSSAPPPLPVPSLAGGASVALGEVTRVDELPERGRVRVLLPAYGNLETGWLQVVSAGAGESKGVIALPEPGDRVLLLLPQDDPAQGLVLGGIYAMHSAPESKTTGNRVGCYTLLTRDGQTIQLDDTRHAIRLEDRQGNLVDLSPEQMRIHAAVDLDIAAPGRRVTIRAARIDFERA
jgi:phage baseplate assembly protein V